jgi:molecular chaperone HscA
MSLLEIFDPRARPRPIGIDLGTTNSLVARVRDGRPLVIADCDGERLVPSAVSYTDRGVVVGRRALLLGAEHPRDTIVSVKRFMGRGAGDAETRRLGTHDFVEPKTAEEAKSVRFRVQGRVVTPVEVSAEILRALAQLAEDELKTVGGAVITVPAYFDDAQRQATRDAGRLAGLDVLRLLNEPTAAALAYGLEKQKNGLFAVYDLGGGTFDITILLLDGGVFQVKSTGGDSALGGDDMDRALAQRFLAEMGVAEGGAPGVVRLALDTARRVKHALTDVETVDVALPAPHGEKNVTVTRAEFDALIAPLVDRTGVACRRALRDAGIKPEELDGVILVGGSTRVPAVRAYVEKLFGKKPLGDIDPDEVVALGAAIQADILAGEEGREGEVLLLDVLPLSLGIETMGGVAEKILPRNTTIPAGARQVFTTYADRQTGFDLHIVQGERELAADCRSLARFTLKGIPPMPAGLARLEVTFRVDADGLLSVTAKEVTTGVEAKVEVKPSYGLSDEEVETMLLAALDHGEDDLDKRRLIEARVEAEQVLRATRKALAADADLLPPEERARVDQTVVDLEAAIAGERVAAITAGTEALDDATHGWAGRRMDRAVARAIAGKQVGDVERDVAHAEGVDAHVEAHAHMTHPGQDGGHA